VSGNQAYDVAKIRADFPILSREIYGKPLVFLDSAASAQKPKQVIAAMTAMMENDYANVHRGAHFLSQSATDLFETAREKVATFLNAHEDEIIFTRGGTESMNLVASCFGRANFKPGDQVITTVMEHHANIVPWQMLQETMGIEVKFVPTDKRGVLDMAVFHEMLNPKVKIVSVAHVSNVLGTVNPVEEIIAAAHAIGVPVMLDGCQGVTHGKVDVKALDVDFYVFSGHKLYGPSGIGVLFGKKDLMNSLPPYQGGGDMIESVTLEGTTFKETPHRFEAGTPAIVEAVGLGAAIDYINEVGMDAIGAHEALLLEQAMDKLGAIEGVELIGTAPNKVSVLAFNVEGIHPLDVATVLDREGIAVRVGQHCAEPLIRSLGFEATIRASFGMYNTLEEVDKLVAGVEKAIRMFKG
jgi:cysteine desulfurase/selenocysteine lyase